MTKPRKPASFRLEEIEVVDTLLPPPAIATDAAQLPATVRGLPALERGWRWGSILLAAVGGLVGLASVVWLHDLVREMMARQDWIGWTTIGLLGLVVLALLMIILREAAGLARLGRLGRLRHEADARARRRQGARARRREPAEAPLSWAQGPRLGSGAARRARGRHLGCGRAVAVVRAHARRPARSDRPAHRCGLRQAGFGGHRGEPRRADRHAVRGFRRFAHAAPARHALRRAPRHALAPQARPHGRHPYRAHGRDRARRRRGPTARRARAHGEALGASRRMAVQRRAHHPHRARGNRCLPSAALYRGAAAALSRACG